MVGMDNFKITDVQQAKVLNNFKSAKLNVT